MNAIEQWAYLYFMSLMNESNYNNLIANNEGVSNFYSQFYNEYKDDCDNYINMYKESRVILERLKQLSDNYENAVITFGVDDPVLSTNITNLENDIKYLLVRGEDNNIIKYIGPNYAYTYAKNLFGSDYVNLSSVDDYNHLVLARELNRRNNVKTKFNINYSNDLDNLVGSFDILTINDLFEQDEKFINADVASTNDIIEVDTYYARDLSSDQTNKYIDDINGLTKNQMIICNSNYTDSKLLSDLFFENYSVFNFASFGGWNTNANAIGTQIGRTVSYAILSNDISNCIDSKQCTKNKITSDLNNRVINYDKTRLIGALEDIVYNLMFRYNSSLNNSNYVNNLKQYKYFNDYVNDFFDNNFDISGYQYKYSKANSNISFVKPWNRTFEIKYTIDLLN